MSTDTNAASSEFIPTRVSLIEGITDPANDARWEEFRRVYAPLIRGLAVKSGLTLDEQDDALQETLTAVFRQIPNFRYDPAKCSFKSWLGTLAKGCIVDQLRKRPPRGRLAHLPHDPATSTEPLAQIPDTASLDLDAYWNTEYEKTVSEAALAGLKPKVRPLHFQIFHLHVVRQQPARAVAKALGVKVGQVYLVKLRVLPLFKRIVAALQNQPI